MFTGKLHLGHAWDTTLQDIITRMKRMQGIRYFISAWYGSCWYSNSQAKVEAKLNEQGISRHDLGREIFTASMERKNMQHLLDNNGLNLA